MHFLSEKLKSMLQSKQSDQFDTLRLVSDFRCECFLPNSFFLFPRKVERGWKLTEKYRWPTKNAKVNVNIDCFSSIKGQWKLFNKGQGQVREFWLFDEWQPWCMCPYIKYLPNTHSLNLLNTWACDKVMQYCFGSCQLNIIRMSNVRDNMYMLQLILYFS